MLQAVRETAAWTTDKISAIRVLSEATARHVQQRLPKIYSREIIDVIFTRPYCRIANLVDAGLVKRQTAARYLHALVEIDVLTQKKVGRERLFMNHRLLRLLTLPGNAFEPFTAGPDSHCS
jgi:Fic family protein